MTTKITNSRIINNDTVHKDPGGRGNVIIDNSEVSKNKTIVDSGGRSGASNHRPERQTIATDKGFLTRYKIQLQKIMLGVVTGLLVLFIWSLYQPAQNEGQADSRLETKQ